jgi:hypothetical protein
MNIIKESAKLIGWIGGSIAGFGAIFYACGYIATQTHLYSLGLESILEYSPQYYLIRGANFLIVISSYMMQLFYVFSPLFLIFFTFYFLITHEKFKKHIPFRNRLDHINARWNWLWKLLVFFSLLFVLFFHLATGLGKDRSPLNISGLLFSTGGDLTRSKTQETKNPDEAYIENVKKWIITGDRNGPEGAFSLIILKVVEAGLLLLLAWRVTLSWRLHVLLVLPFLVMFVIYIALLPMLYGVLLKQTEISEIKLLTANDRMSFKSDNLFLLHKTEQEFILWNSTKNKVFWLSRDMIQAAAIGQSRPLSEIIQKKTGGKTDD